MSFIANDVKARAGALIRAWREQNLAAFDGELHRAGKRRSNAAESGFDAERRELLECLAHQMRGAAQSMTPERPVRAVDVDVCLGLLEHLATR